MSEEKSVRKLPQKAAKKYCRFRYGEDVLAKAIQDVKDGIESLNSASKKYNIPKSTLHNKINAKTPNIRKMGPKPVLDEFEESRLEQWILAKAKLGFPMHPSEVKDAVQKILTETNRPNPFKNNRPGEKWLKLFLQRHPNIVKRNTEIISKSRAAVTETAIRKWFQDLKQYLLEHDLLDMMEYPCRIYNADETGVRTCVKSGLVLGPISKNFKNFYEISSGNEKESITVLCTYSASGVAAPPMVLFPYKRIPKELALSVPGTWGTGRSDSGWMTAATFFEYVANVFYNWLVEKQITFPVILFIDGHKSHYSIELYEFCVKKKIILYCLYPNSTHILQPCDVTIFRPLKVEWKKVCQAHKQKTSASITRYNFCPLFKEAFEKASQPNTIIKGFEICGLYPLNPDNVDFSKCISTRRNELFPKPKVGDNELTFQDCKSCLKVMNHFLGTAKLAEYEDLENNARSEDTTYALWKFCADFKNKSDSNSSTANESEFNFDNGGIAQQEPTYEDFTETFLNDLPFEIDGVLYPAFDNNDDYATGKKKLEELDDANQITFSNCDSKNSDNLFNRFEPVDSINGTTDFLNCDTKNSDDLIKPVDSINGTTEIKEFGDKNETTEFTNLSSEEYTVMIKVIMEIILDRVFETVEKKKPSHSTVIYTQDTSHGGIENIKSDKKIQVLSNIIVREKTDIEVWEKHLHWPHQNEKVCKRKNAKKMPFAITSLKWLEYYEQQDKAKQEKEEAARLRKLKKEQKASTSQAEKNIIIKRKRERKDKNKTVGTKKIKKEKHFQAKELKKTSSKGERREDESSSSGSDDLTEVEENQRNSTKNKSKHEKEEAARVRTLKKEQKASSSQAKKSIIIKRKRERKDKDKTVGTKKIKKEKHFQAKELKKTSSKGERREDESSSSGSDDLTEVEEEQRNSTKNKSENLTDKNLETKQILKIGDYVVVKYDDKFYPGLIKATDREEYEVSVMKHSSNGKWKWPKLTDQIWYKKHQIIKKIKQPKPLTSGGFYNVQM
ncbi:uncharacterized protein [Tenebrio molitor]|uniref:uncharacterized protein n=1 Tax=Tenebrio molitor TaxID=7067 RepID=UPI0036247EA3